MIYRALEPQKDQKAMHRIWREIGWISETAHEKGLDAFLEGNKGLVAEINGEAECMVVSSPGTFRYLDEELPLSAVTAVATSRVARKQGHARKLTAQLIGTDALDGALVSALGIFEQGFYDQLGYGTGPYEHWISFDPAQLNVKTRARVPRRLGKEDAGHFHQAMLNRQRGHGVINLLSPKIIESEIAWISNGFGLGYADGPNGELSHCFWATGSGEHGPYSIVLMAYQNGEQLLELLVLMKNLGDQVRLVTMREPQGIQMQDFLTQPFRYRQLTGKSKFENINKATAYWQLRICDLNGCLARTHLQGDAVRFNLVLSDPIVDAQKKDAPWQGIGGEYIVTLGPESEAVSGQDAALPTLIASVGAFSRLWMGARPATGLAISDNLAGPPDLLTALDRILRLPEPKPGWDF